MMSNQQRMNAIASQFGDRDKISIFLGREKIYPAKELSDATVERLKNTLRSPQSEKGTLRVLEETVVSKKAELIYRSSQGAIDFDPKNIAPQFQDVSVSQVPQTLQVEQSLTVEQSLEKEQKLGEKIIHAAQNKNTIPFPINPTQAQMDEKMQEILNPSDTLNHGSLEQALFTANARIDALQTQLEDTKKSLQELSKFVCNDNLKSWAEHKAHDILNTSQSIAKQAKNKLMQWMQSKTSQVKEVVHEKVNKVKVVAHEKVNETKTLTQEKGNEVKTFAQLKAIEFKEAIREQANNFLAPVDSQKVEQAAKYVVRAYGDGKSYEKAATHSFQLNDKNELSIARQADGAVVYQKGELTKAANSHDILKLNALPAIVDQIKTTQMQTFQKQEMEVGS